MKKLLVLLVVSAFVLASVSAQAYTVTYQDYISANANTNDQSGLTSVYGTNALVKPSGSSLINFNGVNALYDGGIVYFTETFDIPQAGASLQYPPQLINCTPPSVLAFKKVPQLGQLHPLATQRILPTSQIITKGCLL
jgi:hypothetical protein